MIINGHAAYAYKLQQATNPPLFVNVLTSWSILREDDSVSIVHAQCQQFDGTIEQCTVVSAVVPLPSPSAFYIHYVFLFPMELVAYSSAV